MDYIFELLVANLTAIAGGILWFARLEGRLNHVESKLDGRLSHLEKVFDAHLHDKQVIMSDLHRKIERIEGKLDQIAIRCAAFNHRPVPGWAEGDGGEG